MREWSEKGSGFLECADGLPSVSTVCQWYFSPELLVSFFSPIATAKASGHPRPIWEWLSGYMVHLWFCIPERLPKVSASSFKQYFSKKSTVNFIPLLAMDMEMVRVPSFMGTQK